MDTVAQREFYDACKKGQIQNVDVFSKVIINTGFYYACEEGHLNVVKWLLAKGATNMNACSSACANGHFAVVKYLISKEKCYHNNLLVSACAAGHFEFVQLLVTLKNVTRFGKALVCAYVRHHSKIVEFLISNCNGFFDIPVLSFHSYCGTERHMFELLEMGVVVESFFNHTTWNKECKNLLDDIQTFKTRAFLVIQNALIPELSKLIVDYSLK